MRFKMENIKMVSKMKYFKLFLVLPVLAAILFYSKSSYSFQSTVNRYARHAYKHNPMCVAIGRIAPLTFPRSYPAAVIIDPTFPCEWFDDAEPAIDRRVRLYYTRTIYLELLKEADQN